MKGLNAAWRGINETTDVLSFPQIGDRCQELGVRVKNKDKIQNLKLNSSPFTPYSSLLLGDIVLNIQITALNAEKSNTDLYSEISRLLVHGVLHLFGYDHEQSRYEARKMRGKEQEILNALKKMD